MHTGKQIGVNNIGCVRFHNRLTILFAGVSFLRCQPTRAYVSKISSHGLRREYTVTIRNRSRQGNRTLKKFAYLTH